MFSQVFVRKRTFNNRLISTPLILLISLLFSVNSLFADETIPVNTDTPTQQEVKVEDTVEVKLSAFKQAERLLTEKAFKKKKQAIELLIGSNNESSRKWLEQLAKGKLYFHKKDKGLTQITKSSPL